MFKLEENFVDGKPVLTIVSGENCGNCVSVKNMLNQRGIKFKELKLGTDLESVQGTGLVGRTLPLMAYGSDEIFGTSSLMTKLIKGEIK
jgi:glutaredoxin